MSSTSKGDLNLVGSPHMKLNRRGSMSITFAPWSRPRRLASNSQEISLTTVTCTGRAKHCYSTSRRENVRLRMNTRTNRSSTRPTTYFADLLLAAHFRGTQKNASNGAHQIHSEPIDLWMRPQHCQTSPRTKPTSSLSNAAYVRHASRQSKEKLPSEIAQPRRARAATGGRT